MVSTGLFAPGNFVIGFALSFAILTLFHVSTRRSNVYLSKTVKTVSLLIYFLRELLLSNVRVAIQTLGPKHRLRPGILAIPVEPMPDAALTILANTITLTPGTLTLDISDDRSTLFVHFMHVEDPEAMRREIKDGFERRILEIFSTPERTDQDGRAAA